MRKTIILPKIRREELCFIALQRTRAFALGLEQAAKESYLFALSASNVAIVLVIAAYILSYFAEKAISGLAFDTLTLRLFVCLSIVVFLLKKWWPKWAQQAGHIIWMVNISIMLPFCFGTIVVVDAALSPRDSPPNTVALMQYVLSVFFLVQALFSIKLILISWLIASAFAFVPLIFIDSPNLKSVADSIFFIIPFFATILLVGGVISRGIFSIQNEKEQAVWNVANAVAHQLRTPLATIRNLSTGTLSQLPVLIDGYHFAALAGKVERPISEHKLEQLRDALDSISEEVRHSNALIDILIANSKPIEKMDVPTTPVSIRTVIERAIKGYPYNNPFERSLVAFESDTDFDVYATENMLLHVLYNLIGNAVVFSQRSRYEPAIDISLTQTDAWNLVKVRDNGLGVPRDSLQRIFDPFFSQNSPNGTGIGLSFCKSVMEGLGGKIECQSEEGEYCEMILYFPKSPAVSAA